MVWDPPQEYERMYRRYSPMVQRRARALLGSDADALDVVQDLFISLYERPEQFAGGSKLSTFLYAATTHACWSRLRKHKVRSKHVEDELRADEGAPSSPSAEALTLLRQVLVQLDEELAQVAVYYYLDQMTHEEIASIVGCSRRQVGYLLERLSTQMGDRRLS